MIIIINLYYYSFLTLDISDITVNENEHNELNETYNRLYLNNIFLKMRLSCIFNTLKKLYKYISLLLL